MPPPSGLCPTLPSRRGCEALCREAEGDSRLALPGSMVSIGSDDAALGFLSEVCTAPLIVGATVLHISTFFS